MIMIQNDHYKYKKKYSITVNLKLTNKQKIHSADKIFFPICFN